MFCLALAHFSISSYHLSIVLERLEFHLSSKASGPAQPSGGVDASTETEEEEVELEAWSDAEACSPPSAESETRLSTVASPTSMGRLAMLFVLGVWLAGFGLLAACATEYVLNPELQQLFTQEHAAGLLGCWLWSAGFMEASLPPPI
jgi:hypothetical protein